MSHVGARAAAAAALACAALAFAAPALAAPQPAAAHAARTCFRLLDWKKGTQLQLYVRGVSCKFARTWITSILRGRPQPPWWACNRTNWPSVTCRRGSKSFRSKLLLYHVRAAASRAGPPQNAKARTGPGER